MDRSGIQTPGPGTKMAGYNEGLIINAPKDLFSSAEPLLD
jgi:hypothetical protein